MRALFSKEPALLAELFKAALVVAVAFGLPLTGAQTAALVGLVVPMLALAGLTRSVVSSPATVAQVATEAATRTAERLSSSAAGKVGELTATGVNVAQDVAQDVVGAVGGIVGKLAPKEVARVASDSQ